ncbi:MAG: OstA-like protein [Flavobacteriales bacterium]
MRAALFFPLFIGFLTSSAQTDRIEILGVDQLEFDDSIAPGAQRLLGNARFKHADAIMTCDSAYIYEDQSVKAFGHVTISQGDTLRITGHRLDYLGKDRRASIQGKGDLHGTGVLLTNPDMQLTTDALVYELRSRTAVYSNGGTIISTKENNTLTSRRGLYMAGERAFLFSDSVVLKHPERTIASDTLRYETANGIARFFGPTTITQKDGSTVFCNEGWYDTRKDLARFGRGARLVSRAQEITGDSIRYDRKAGIGEAFGNVTISDTTNDMLVRGDRAWYDEGHDKSIVTGRAEMVMMISGDSLFLHGDSLVATTDTLRAHSTDTSSTGEGRAEARLIRAFHGVRFFKSDLQGACDSLVYAGTDSVIHMFRAPVLWSGKDQITGDSVQIALRDGKAHRLFVRGNAFMASQADSVHYDQVAGRTLTGYFSENELRTVVAEGNSRTVYFAKEKKDGEERIMGMNTADCSRIDVAISSDTSGQTKVHTVSFITQPDAVLWPLGKAPADQQVLPGFLWRGGERPVRREAIFESAVD